MCLQGRLSAACPHDRCTEMEVLIDLIAGARPNFMKIAPIVAAINVAQSEGSPLRFRLIHTGQHYDRNMSGLFFEDLDIPEPDLNLGVGSGTAAQQTAGIMIGYEQALLAERSRLCVVVGDVTSTMACAITAQKLGVPVAHIEGGLRSGDWSMPEEINRLVTDSITNHFFTTSAEAGQNLRASGVGAERIHFVGNTMIDTLLRQRPRFRQPRIWKEAGLETGRYFVLTLHRPANVDVEERLAAMLNAVIAGSRGLPVIFPVHPRTARAVAKLDFAGSNLHCTDPMGYLEFNFLVERAFAVITDSGGITEETTVLGVPCLTLRDTTERPETITLGTNELVGTDPARLKPVLERLFAGDWKQGKGPPLWDGNAGKRIVAIIGQLLAGQP